MSASSNLHLPGFPSQIRYGWTLALTLLGLSTLLTLWLLWPSALSMAHIWFNSQTYAHGTFIPALTLFLIWTRRQELARQSPEPWAWGLIWIALATLAWILARGVDVKTVQHFALVAMLPGLVLTLLGPRLAWSLVFPLAYLFFAVPFGDFIVPPLMDYTAWFSVLLLKLSGVPVHMDGHYISIPAADFVVIEACSGVRYLIASLALGLVYAYLNYNSLWRRLAFMALAIGLPMLANGLRAYSIIITAHVTDGRIILGYGHIVVGWVFFGVVMFLMFWIGSFWADRHGPVDARNGAAPRASSQPVNAFNLALIMLAVVGVLGSARGTEVLLQQRAQQTRVEAPIRLPSAVPGWQGPEDVADVWRPAYHDADAELAGRYRDNGGAVELHLLHYRNRGQGTELISWRNQIHERNETWRPVAGRSRTLTDNDGQPRAVQETLLRGPSGRLRLIWHWYQIGERATIDRVEVKLRELQMVLIGDGRGAFLVALSTQGDELTLDAARQRLEDFARALPQPVGYHDHDD
ncbi:MAG: exosortase A [Halochromatium sp.]